MDTGTYFTFDTQLSTLHVHKPSLFQQVLWHWVDWSDQKEQITISQSEADMRRAVSRSTDVTSEVLYHLLTLGRCNATSFWETKWLQHTQTTASARGETASTGPLNQSQMSYLWFKAVQKVITLDWNLHKMFGSRVQSTIQQHRSVVTPLKLPWDIERQKNLIRRRTLITFSEIPLSIMTSAPDVSPSERRKSSACTVLQISALPHLLCLLACCQLSLILLLFFFKASPCKEEMKMTWGRGTEREKDTERKRVSNARWACVGHSLRLLNIVTIPQLTLPLYSSFSLCVSHVLLKHLCFVYVWISHGVGQFLRNVHSGFLSNWPHMH